MKNLQDELVKAGLALPPQRMGTQIIDGEPSLEREEAVKGMVLSLYRKPGGKVEYRERSSRTKILEVKKIMAGVDTTRNAYQLLECLSLHPRVTAMELTKLFNEGRTEGKIGRRSVDAYLSRYFHCGVVTKQREGASYYYWFKKDIPLQAAYAKVAEATKEAKQKSMANARKARHSQVKQKAQAAPLLEPGVQKLIVEVIGKVEFVFRLG